MLLVTPSIAKPPPPPLPRPPQHHAARCILWLFVLVLGLPVTSSWDPDAGLVTSLTKSSAARVFASSREDEAFKANDGDDGSHWVSRGCLPGGFYLGNALTNVLLDACGQGRCSTSSSDVSEIGHVTDSSQSTAYQVRKGGAGVGGTQATFTVTLPARDHLRHVTVRGTFQAPTHVILADGATEQDIGTLTSSDNHQLRDFNVTLTPTTSLTLRSDQDFTLHVLGAIGQAGCLERVYVDLGAPRRVKLVRTRHWAGHHGLTSRLVTSEDGVTWRGVAALEPNALQPVVTVLDPAETFRYVGVEHRHDEDNFAKVYVWEIDAYPNSGLYGAPPAPCPNPHSLRDMLGVNGIWGWGWGRSSPRVPPGEGPALYAPVASSARNYHNLDWDVRDPDRLPGYDRMALGHGTDAQSWLNWDTEYAEWKAANLTVHVSVQFLARTFPVSVWDQPYNSSFRYGYSFARHFGPTHGLGLVRSVEVGNEPWDYPAPFYSTVLDGMASGFKAADPHMKVMPGAFQAHDPTNTGNYIGTRVTQQLVGNIDVINGHHYSWRHHSDGSRRATYPEDPAGSFGEIHSLIRWRDVNVPDRPVWVTEWGWDSAGGGQSCSKFPECTTEDAASAYAARGLLLHARLGVARSFWFFFGNLDDCDDHVFCRSGLTSSMSANFTKKGPYLTLHSLLQRMGHTSFIQLLREDDTAHVYLFGTPFPSSFHPTPTHLVAWRPVDAETEWGREVTVTFSYPGSAGPSRAWRLRADGQERETAVPVLKGGGQWTMSVGVMPTVVQLAEALIG
ncbi:uncharacterized protein LOC143293587 [Babylonia areolata]|uniref:uncharacterized protein LOC143293587 n=1 Tax=Babylonia areolata TaxID=304850 RepID=UPI003FD6563B